LDDADGSFYNELTGINFSLRLLDLQKTLSNFGVISDLHEVHALDLNTSNSASDLEHLFQMFRNNGSVVEETGLIRVVRAVGELGTDTTEDIVSLVSDKIVQVDNMIDCLNWSVNSIRYDS